MRTAPSRNSSPSASRTGDLILRSPTDVPFLLPRSSRTTPVAVTRMAACRRETEAASSRPVASWSRPTTCSPSSEVARPPGQVRQPGGSNVDWPSPDREPCASDCRSGLSATVSMNSIVSRGGSTVDRGCSSPRTSPRVATIPSTAGTASGPIRDRRRDRHRASRTCSRCAGRDTSTGRGGAVPIGTAGSGCVRPGIDPLRPRSSPAGGCGRDRP
jgi:hypothetical protein